MEARNGLRILSNFFLDGAKITFASLVVGIFAPDITGKNLWISLTLGIIATIALITLAILSNQIQKP